MKRYYIFAYRTCQRRRIDVKIKSQKGRNSFLVRENYSSETLRYHFDVIRLPEKLYYYNGSVLDA